MFVGDLFEKKNKEKDDTPRGFVGGKSQIAGVKRALDRAYQENPAARNDFEAMAGHIDKVDTLNAQQSRLLKQQELENTKQTQQIQALSKDIQDKEQRFRDLNAQIADMPNVTPQQVAKMTQDLEKAHDDQAGTGKSVDVKDIITKHVDAKSQAKVAQPTQRLSTGPAVSAQRTTTPQATAQTKSVAPQQTTPSDTGAKAFGAMAGQLTNPNTTYTAKPAPGDQLKKSAAAADIPTTTTAQNDNEFNVLGQDEIDQLLSTHEKEKAVAEAEYRPGNPNIGGLNWTGLMQAWKAGNESVDWKFPTNQAVRLYRPQMFAILQVVAGTVKKSGRAAQEQIIQEIFSSRDNTIDWLNQTTVRRYIELYPDWLAKQQAQLADPQNPQGSLIGPSGEPTPAAMNQREPQQGELFKEGRMKDLDLRRQEQTAGEEEPVGDFSVVRKDKNGQWQLLKQHYSSNKAFSHAQNIKNKYPSMQVGVRWPTGQINLVGLRESKESDAVYGAIIRRIIGAHPSLISSFGVEAVMSAVQDVAEWNSDVEEIGSSDVSAWVRQVFRKLQEEN